MRLATVAATDIVDVVRGRGSENSIFSRNQSLRRGHDHFANLKNRFSLSSSRGVLAEIRELFHPVTSNMVLST